MNKNSKTLIFTALFMLCLAARGAEQNSAAPSKLGQRYWQPIRAFIMREWQRTGNLRASIAEVIRNNYLMAIVAAIAAWKETQDMLKEEVQRQMPAKAEAQ